MKALLERAELNTDFDAQFHDLLNVRELVPPPPDLVLEGDSRLSDARNPLPGSVVDASVALDAGIVQSKLNLNGLMPPAWFGSTSTTAARGDLAELLERKAQPNGYASLDGAGKLPLAQLPPGAGTGTVTSIGISMPAQFSVAGSPVTTNGTIAIGWQNVPDGSWFGNTSGVPAAPTFQSGPLPVGLIPNLDASKITSGVFISWQLPPAIGVGLTHAPGAVPDPGETGNPTDYLARDMTYHPLPSFGPTYQPDVPNPLLAISSGPPPYSVSITSILPGTSLFYSVDNQFGGYAPVPEGGSILIGQNHTVYAYGAKSGYTNSDIVFISSPVAPPTEEVVTGDPLNPNEKVIGDDSLTVTVGP